MSKFKSFFQLFIIIIIIIVIFIVIVIVIIIFIIIIIIIIIIDFRLEQILEYAEDIEIDVPHFWNYLGELLGPTAFDGNIDLNKLFKCVLRYVPNHKAAKLFAYMLQTATNDTVSWIYIVLS